MFLLWTFLFLILKNKINLRKVALCEERSFIKTCNIICCNIWINAWKVWGLLEIYLFGKLKQISQVRSNLVSLNATSVKNLRSYRQMLHSECSNICSCIIFLSPKSGLLFTAYCLFPDTTPNSDLQVVSTEIRHPSGPFQKWWNYIYGDLIRRLDSSKSFSSFALFSWGDFFQHTKLS